VRVAAPLDDQTVQALHDALIRVFKRPLELDIEVKPDILGGVWVRVGDTVIDGSLTGKLETLRHHLRSQCHSLLSASARFSARGLKQ
jgi:F-type H+-transporting ATPase subunit delta